MIVNLARGAAGRRCLSLLVPLTLGCSSPTASTEASQEASGDGDGSQGSGATSVVTTGGAQTTFASSSSESADGSSSGTGGEPVVAQDVGPDGGIVYFPGGEIEILPGALAETHLITVTVADAAPEPPIGAQYASEVFVFGPEGLHFDLPFVVRLDFTDPRLGIGSPMIFRFSDQWAAVGGPAADSKETRVEASSDNFSSWTVGWYVGTCALEGWQNPVQPNQDCTYTDVFSGYGLSCTPRLGSGLLALAGTSCTCTLDGMAVFPVTSVDTYFCGFEAHMAWIFSQVCGFQCGDSACDPWLQDCPDGYKCNPWANDGGTEWNANKCVPSGPVQVGGLCTVEGHAVSGVDNCESGSMCFFVPEDALLGECVPYCSGSPAAPECPQDTACLQGNEGSLNLCLPTCDPLPDDLNWDCNSGTHLCVPNEFDFVCAPDAAQFEPGGYGVPCEHVNACDHGFFCASGDVFPDGVCDDFGCCASFCDLDAFDPLCQEGTECVSWYESDQIPMVGPLADLGACMVPL